MAVATSAAMVTDALITTQDQVAPTPTSCAKPVQRLPDRLRDAELYAIQSEDHYLRVHASVCNDLVLMRMADALLEIDGVDG